MVQKKGRKKVYIIAGIALAAVLVVIVIVTIANALNSGKSDPYRQTNSTPVSNSSEDTNEPAPSPDDGDTSDSQNNDTQDSTQPASTLDPETVATITIDPMNIIVSYVKGVGGFEYAIKRTASGTQYVEFSSPELVGTKCTNDTGAFASILANPGTDANATLTKSIAVDGTKYGLSLTAVNCTSNEALLKRYQASFSDAFELLKKS